MDRLQKGQPDTIRWGVDAVQALTRLKVDLCLAPVLYNLDFTLPFLLHPDASDTALGAVLSQVYPDGEHPVVYLSRKLHPLDCRYSTIEDEALALKWEVESLQYYLTNNPFTLVTDNAPLQWLHKEKNSNSHILGCYLALLSFSFRFCIKKEMTTSMLTTSPIILQRMQRLGCVW